MNRFWAEKDLPSQRSLPCLQHPRKERRLNRCRQCIFSSKAFRPFSTSSIRRGVLLAAAVSESREGFAANAGTTSLSRRNRHAHPASGRSAIPAPMPRLALLLGLAGVAILQGGGASLAGRVGLGCVAALGAGLCWAGYSLFVRGATEARDELRRRAEDRLNLDRRQ